MQINSKKNLLVARNVKVIVRRDVVEEFKIVCVKCNITKQYDDFPWDDEGYISEMIEEDFVNLVGRSGYGSPFDGAKYDLYFCNKCMEGMLGEIDGSSPTIVYVEPSEVLEGQ